MLLLGKSGLAATYMGSPARRTGISVTGVESGSRCEARNAEMTRVEISVTTCMIIGAVALAEKRVWNKLRMEESLSERIATFPFTDMVVDLGNGGVQLKKLSFHYIIVVSSRYLRDFRKVQG